MLFFAARRYAVRRAVSVRPSVRLSRSHSASKRVNMFLKLFHDLVATPF